MYYTFLLIANENEREKYILLGKGNLDFFSNLHEKMRGKIEIWHVTVRKKMEVASPPQV